MSKELLFCEEMYFRHHYKVKCNLQQEIKINISAIGLQKVYKPSAWIKCLAENLLGKINTFMTFQRILLKNKVIHSVDYKRVTKRNSYTVKYVRHSKTYFGFIKYFLKCSMKCLLPGSCTKKCPCKIANFIAILDEFQVVNDDPLLQLPMYNLPHLIPVLKKTNSQQCCYVSDIKELCFFIDSKNHDFVMVFPNTIESD